MSAKHTQGPWSVEHDTDITGIEKDPANGCVGKVDVAHVYLRTVPARTEANARLIAAAPELLQALRSMVDLYDTDEGCHTLPQYVAARAAVAKATGQ